MTDIFKAYYDWTSGRRKLKQNKMTARKWISWWVSTGKFDQRGSGRGQYYMSRIDKTKPFSIDNIELKQYNIKRKK